MMRSIDFTNARSKTFIFSMSRGAEGVRKGEKGGGGGVYLLTGSPLVCVCVTILLTFVRKQNTNGSLQREKKGKGCL